VTIHVSPDIQPHRNDTQRSIVVGVDPSGRSASAVVWAVDEAERRAAGLTLLSAIRGEQPSDASSGEHDLASLARRLTMSSLRQRAVDGDPVDALLDAAVDADLLVVGARTLRPTQRMILGSTSRAVAAWSPVPMVVVPEPWMQPSMASAPIVAGVRPAESAPRGSSGPLDAEVLTFSFARAAALRVPLHIVSAFEPPYLTAWSPSDLLAARTSHDAELDERLAPWREDHPEVEVITSSVAEPADHAVLEAARTAQLAVVGRHHSTALSGVLGATARGVLAHASRPVAVVPSGDRDVLTREVRRRHGSEAFWAPTF
jgi:nucleotide-binding universal stress UspA family protein